MQPVLVDALRVAAAALLLGVLAIWITLPPPRRNP